MRPVLVLAFLLLLVLGHGSRAVADEISVAGGIEGDASSWEGDRVGYLSLRAAYAWESLGVYVIGKSGAGEVDDRMLQHLGFGGQLALGWGRYRPVLRAGVVHQHEVARVDVDADPAGSLLGYGRGIRHRTGASLGAGLRVDVGAWGRGVWFVAVDGGVDLMLGSEGPGVYGGAGVALGVSFPR